MFYVGDKASCIGSTRVSGVCCQAALNGEPIVRHKSHFGQLSKANCSESINPKEHEERGWAAWYCALNEHHQRHMEHSFVA
jgi:hypothetical protein